MVIIGSSFSENDEHIFAQINDSKISTIYTPCKNSKTKIKEKYEIADNIFPNKKIILFDRETISYCKK